MDKTGPKHKMCRRVGAPLCGRPNCPSNKRPYPPGQHGRGRKRISEYQTRLVEKQKLRHIYGVNEKQMRNYFDKATRSKGVTGEEMIRMLECRLDTVCLRLGFALTTSQARQLVSHGHFMVNGIGTNIPSYAVAEGDRVEVREASRKSEYFKNARETLKGAQRPDWLSVDADKLSGSVTAQPRRDQMPAELNEQLVVEFYSR